MRTNKSHPPKHLTAPAKTVETVKKLHQYYRDCLSHFFEFPNTGEIPPTLIRWAANSRNTNITQLAEYMQQYPPSRNISPEHDLALRLMLFTIMQANLSTDINNRFTDHIIPPSLADNIRCGISRILSLHDHDTYFINSIQVLYRTNMIDDVLNLLEGHPEIIEKSAVTQAIAGFIYMILGNYSKSLHYLNPLVINETHRDLPLVALSFMTCKYFTKEPTEWPLTFSSLESDTSDLPQLIEKLPPLEIAHPLPKNTSSPIIFVACNDAYFFQHALHLAYSIHESNPGKLALHLHLYSPSNAVLSEVVTLNQCLPNLQIGISVEFGDISIENPAAYYATARFVRAYQILCHYQCELCIMDADALFNSSWDNFKKCLDIQTEVVLACPQTAPFWETVIAGFAYFKPTEKSKYFLGKVSQFILENINQKKTIWFTDQIALSACSDRFATNDPAFKHLDSALLIDMQHKEEALTWGVTTTKTGHIPYDLARKKLSKKYTQLQKISVDYGLDGFVAPAP